MTDPATGPGVDHRIVRGMSRQLERLDAALGSGGRVLGWKLGFGSAAAMAALDIRAPLIGHLVDRARVPSGAVIPLEGWVNPVAEPEMAVHLGAEVPPGVDRETVARAVAGLGPAIELVDIDPPPRDVEAILVGDLYQRGVVLGRVDRSRAGASTHGLVGRVWTASQELVTEDVTALAGDPIELLRHVADVLGGFGRRLEAGQVVITGSVVPPMQVRPGEHLRFELEPIGAVEVSFS